MHPPKSTAQRSLLKYLPRLRIRHGRPANLLAVLMVAAICSGLFAIPRTAATFTATSANSVNSFVADEWKAVIALDGGVGHTCLARDEGDVWCWGLNSNGQLGENTSTDSLVPVQVTGAGGAGVLSDVTAVGAGAEFTCATTEPGAAWCWGLNSNGQLGDNTSTNSLAPVQVKGAGGTGTLADAIDIAGGATFACAVKSDGTVWCWGRNDKGQLGDNTSSNSLVPVQVAGAGGSGTLTGVSSVTAGLTHACAVKSDGTVWCWGLNNNGQLGDNTTTDRLAPVQVTGPGGSGTLTGAVQAAGADLSTCAVKSDGTVWCWGRNDKGQLGDNTSTNSIVPVQVTGAGGTGTLTGAVDLGAGTTHVCAAKSDTTVWCWGNNANGQLGDNTTTNSPAPVQVKGAGGTGTLTGVTIVGAGNLSSCAARADYTAVCWGRNDKGQIGDNTTTDRLTPTQVKGGGWTGV